MQKPQKNNELEISSVSDIYAFVGGGDFSDKMRTIAALSPYTFDWGGRGGIPGLICT
jgi:hypothetical protein